MAIAATVTRAQVVTLYRDILRRSRTFKLTDAGWYRQRVRQEFERHRNDADKARVAILYKRGLAFRDHSGVL